MHNLHYRYPARLGFEPSTFEFRATIQPNEFSWAGVFKYTRLQHRRKCNNISMLTPGAPRYLIYILFYMKWCLALQRYTTSND